MDGSSDKVYLMQWHSKSTFTESLSLSKFNLDSFFTDTCGTIPYLIALVVFFFLSSSPSPVSRQDGS